MMKVLVLTWITEYFRCEAVKDSAQNNASQSFLLTPKLLDIQLNSEDSGKNKILKTEGINPDAN